MCLSAAGQWETALEIVKGMTDSTCKPDAITYGSLIAAYEKGGQWTMALQVGQPALCVSAPQCCQGCAAPRDVGSGGGAVPASVQGARSCGGCFGC